MDYRLVWAVYFVRVGDFPRALFNRDGEQLSCRQLQIARSHEYDHDRFHS
jgi:hypothetical protein